MRRFVAFNVAMIWLSISVAAQDTTPPSVTILAPGAMAKVGGHVSVSVSAHDDTAVTAVEFYKENVLIATDTSSPYEAPFNFNGAVPGKEVLITVVAKDAVGNESKAEHKVLKPTHSLSTPGANLVDGGAFFKVWAPHAREVTLVGDFNDWNQTEHYLWNENGWWFGFEPAAVDGHKYKFFIGGKHKPDPYGRQMEHSAGASIIKASQKFTWTDGQWRTPRFENMIIYELHVGTFIGKNDGQAYPGDFKNFLTKLDYIKSTGANMIEILPIHEVPGPDAPNPTPYLGYSPTGLFAIESSYSDTPGGAYDDFKTLVDAAHSKGLGVIVDVVYNHFSTLDGRDDWYWEYDGGSEHGDGGIFYNRQFTQWGKAPDWSRQEVRDYIQHNCDYLLTEFHLDGLRWDVTSAIKDKPSGWDAMRDIVWETRQRHPGKIMICENLPYEKSLVEEGNFHSGWWVDYNKKIKEAFQKESNASLNEVKQGINGGDYSHVTKRIIYAMSHDECRNGNGYLVADFGGRLNWNALAKARASAALCFMSPGIPMLFQGEEFANDIWFDDNYQHAVDWSYERDTDGSRMKALYQHATKMRWDYEALRVGSLEWVHEDHDNKVLAFRRDWGDQHLLVVVNFSNRTFGDHSYAVPTGRGGQWTQVLCSQDARFGGWDGAGNAFYEPTANADGKIAINLPKFGVIVFKQK